MIYTQEGMSVLAQETGGLFLQGANDVAGALRKAAEDSDGYYLIGYHPDANTFENRNGQPKFHKIEVKVTRTGWHVRSRDGFFGEPTAEYRSRCFGKSRLAHWTNQIRRLVRGGPVKPIPLQAYWAVVARLRKNDP